MVRGEVQWKTVPGHFYHTNVISYKFRVPSRVDILFSTSPLFGFPILTNKGSSPRESLKKVRKKSDKKEIES